MFGLSRMKFTKIAPPSLMMQRKPIQIKSDGILWLPADIKEWVILQKDQYFTDKSMKKILKNQV